MTHTLRGGGYGGSEDGTGRGKPLVYENHGQDSRTKQVEVCPQLNAKAGTGGNNLPLVTLPAIAFLGGAGSESTICDGEQVPTLGATRPVPDIMHRDTVRRLTPIECERLQGFPDDWTLIPWKKRNNPSGHHAIADFADTYSCPDGPRYKALGNSIAVPVLRHIGQRIETVERILRKET